MSRNAIYRGIKVLFILSILWPTIGKMMQYDQILTQFTTLGYPIYLTYILSVAYVLGIFALLQNRARTLKEWAYAGFTFALLGASASHYLAEDVMANIVAPLIPLVFLFGAYYLENRQDEPAAEGDDIAYEDYGDEAY